MPSKVYRDVLFPHVEWRFGGSVSRDVILSAAEEIRIVFPDSYVDMCEKADGAVPTPDCLFCDGIERVFGSLLAHSPEGIDRFLDYARNLAGTWPDGIVPFASGPFGDFLCFDYRESRVKLQGIVYWSHEEASLKKGGGLTPVAASFEELVSSLFD